VLRVPDQLSVVGHAPTFGRSRYIEITMTPGKTKGRLASSPEKRNNQGDTCRLETTEMAVCLGCGGVIAHRRAQARYCSASCEQDSYRRRIETRAAEAERAREAHQRAVDLAHSLIG